MRGIEALLLKSETTTSVCVKGDVTVIFAGAQFDMIYGTDMSRRLVSEGHPRFFEIYNERIVKLERFFFELSFIQYSKTGISILSHFADTIWGGRRQGCFMYFPSRERKFITHSLLCVFLSYPIFKHFTPSHRGCSGSFYFSHIIL